KKFLLKNNKTRFQIESAFYYLFISAVNSAWYTFMFLSLNVDKQTVSNPCSSFNTFLLMTSARTLNTSVRYTGLINLTATILIQENTSSSYIASYTHYLNDKASL